jgi:DNA-binding transcriptional LysR family regulator
VLREAASLRAAFTRTAAPSGPLRLGIAHAVAFMLAGSPLLRVRACFAEVTPRVSADWSPGLLRRIAGGQLDAAIVVTVGTGAEPPAPAARRLGAAAVTAVAARNAVIDRPASLAQLNDRGWVTHPEGCGYRAAVARALQDGGCAMNIVAETFGIDLQLSLVAAGAGIGLLPIGLLRGQKLAEQLQPIELPELRLQIELWSVRSRQVGQLAPAIAAFEAGVEDLLRCP